MIDRAFRPVAVGTAVGARLSPVGLLRSEMRHAFVWPAASTHPRSLADVLEPHRGGAEAVDRMTKVKRENVLEGLGKIRPSQLNGGLDKVMDIGGSKVHVMEGRCPCLTRARCSQGGYFSVQHTRELTINDFIMLQGVDPRIFAGWERVISDAQMRGLAGNAMSLSVMERVTRAVLHSLGYPVAPDRWA